MVITNLKFSQNSEDPKQIYQSGLGFTNKDDQTVLDFLVSGLIDLNLVDTSNNFKTYLICFLFFVLYAFFLAMFLLSQLKNKLSKNMIPKFLESYLKFEYGNYYAILLILSTILMGVFGYPYVYVAFFLTGIAFLLVSITKTVCTRIRIPMFVAAVIFIVFVFFNTLLKLLIVKQSIESFSFLYTIFKYTTTVSLVLVLLDFLMFIPYKCDPLKGNGGNDDDLFYKI